MAEITLPGPALAWAVPEPRCPVHGRMHEDFALDRWACAGWDGEGCEYTVRSEDRKPVPLGVAGPVTIQMERPWPT